MALDNSISTWSIDCNISDASTELTLKEGNYKVFSYGSCAQPYMMLEYMAGFMKYSRDRVLSSCIRIIKYAFKPHILSMDTPLVLRIGNGYLELSLLPEKAKRKKSLQRVLMLMDNLPETVNTPAKAPPFYREWISKRHIDFMHLSLCFAKDNIFEPDLISTALALAPESLAHILNTTSEELSTTYKEPWIQGKLCQLTYLCADILPYHGFFLREFSKWLGKSLLPEMEAKQSLEPMKTYRKMVYQRAL